MLPERKRMLHNDKKNNASEIDLSTWPSKGGSLGFGGGRVLRVEGQPL